MISLVRPITYGVRKIVMPLVKKGAKAYKKDKHFIDTIGKSAVGAGGISSVTNTIQKTKPLQKKKRRK
jgi:hypothetical protein